MLLALFFAMFAIIIVFQLVPAALMFVGVVKGLFFSKEEVWSKQQ